MTKQLMTKQLMTKQPMTKQPMTKQLMTSNWWQETGEQVSDGRVYDIPVTRDIPQIVLLFAFGRHKLLVESFFLFLPKLRIHCFPGDSILCGDDCKAMLEMKNQYSITQWEQHVISWAVDFCSPLLLASSNRDKAVVNNVNTLRHNAVNIEIMITMYIVSMTN